MKEELKWADLVMFQAPLEESLPGRAHGRIELIKSHSMVLSKHEGECL